NQKLTIFNSAADSALEFSSAAGPDYKWTMGLDYTDGSFRIASSSALGANDRFVIDGSGNVGIGTTGPGQKLDVAGNAVFSGGYVYGSSLTQGYIEINSSGIQVYNAEGTGGNPLRIGSGYAAPGIYRGGDITLRSEGGNIVLNPEGTGVPGNVGIGTTTPGSKLSVSGGVSVGQNYGVAAPSNGMIIEGNVGIGTTSPWGKLSVYSADNASIPQFVVASSSATSLVVDKHGRVGIGKLSPENGLDVAGGSIAVRSGNSIILYNPADNGYVSLFLDASNNVNANYDWKFTGTGNHTIAGNVGIGNTSPNEKLNVQGTIAGQILQATSTTATIW
ncbi:MAG: hypothetical protein UY42_C0033G0001, partial [Parcubacteria group bacterium GW2011_GWA2_49_16]